MVVTAGAINVTIGMIATSYPLSTIEMLTTIPSFFIIFSSFISSFLAKKIGYKNIIVLGLSIVSISGLIPAFIKNFPIIFISRAYFGFGIGLVTPSLVSMIPILFPTEVVSMIGLQSAFTGVGGMLSTFLVGQLLKINWQSAFLMYAIAIPLTILFMVFIPKDEIKVQQAIKIIQQFSFASTLVGLYKTCSIFFLVLALGSIKKK